MSMNRFNPGPPKQPTGDPTRFLDQDDPLEQASTEAEDAGSEPQNRLTPEEEVAETKALGEQIRQLLMYSPKEDTRLIDMGPISRSTAVQPTYQYYDKMGEDYNKGVEQHGYTGTHKDIRTFRKDLHEQARSSGTGLAPDENYTDSAAVLNYRLNGLRVSLYLSVGTRSFITGGLWSVEVADEESNQRSQRVLQCLKIENAEPSFNAYSKPYGENPPPGTAIEDNYLSLDIREACDYFHKVLEACIQLAIEHYDPKQDEQTTEPSEPPTPSLDF